MKKERKNNYTNLHWRSGMSIENWKYTYIYEILLFLAGFHAENQAINFGLTLTNRHGTGI